MVLLTTLAAFALPIDEVPNPRSAGGWVSDTAAVLAPAQIEAINAEIGALNRDLGVEIAVVTITDSDDLEPKPYATALFGRWGIGQAGADNGLLVLLVTGRRRLEMETGYGLEGTLPDGWLGAMQTREMVPHFEAGDYGAGLVAGISAVDARLRADPAPPEAARPVAGWAPLACLPAFGLLGLGLAGAGVAGAAGAYRGWSNRRCSCGGRRLLLDEVADDAHLATGERHEETLGSVDYRVWQCTACAEVLIRPRIRIFSRHRKCAACGHKTALEARRTLQRATTLSGGRVEVQRTCGHCQHVRTEIHTTARLTRSTTSSGVGYRGRGRSRGGGSFGGGRSGGGGAGSSW